MNEQLEIAGFHHVGEVIAMNSRIEGMMMNLNLDQTPEHLQQQLDFLQSCLDAEKRYVIRIPDKAHFNRIIKALQCELAGRKEIDLITDEIQQAIDMA